MKKRLLTCLLLFVFIIGTLLPLPAKGSDPASNGFTFIHITDTHIGSAAGNKNTPRVLQELLKNYRHAAFLVNGGDLTELGTPQEYAYYKELMAPLQMPLYHTPGNHESRWIDAGKSYFKKYFGMAYHSWNYQGIHFVALDSSMANGQHGHFEKQMLEWLKGDLAKTGKTTPVIIFTHHPVFYDEVHPDSKFMDNEWDLWTIIKDYNVPAIFTGHGHRSEIWHVNGTTVFMSAAAMDAGFSIVEMNKTKGELTVYRGVANEQPIKELLARVPLTKPSPIPSLKVLSPTWNQSQKGNFLLKVALENWQSSIPPKVEYRLEDNRWKPLDIVGTTYQKEIDLTEVDDGIRAIWVRSTADDGQIYFSRIQFKVQKGTGPQILWEFNAGGGIQHAPALGSKYLYFGDNSGKLYALDQKTGRKVWEFKTGGSIIGSPSYANGMVYTGSADGKVYAVKAIDGKKVWEYKTGGAVIAPPLTANGRVYVGSSDNHMYALEQKTGTELWRFATGNTIASKATLAEDTVFFGSWDRNFYAVDAATGQEKWKKELGSQTYYAPASSTPLYLNGKIYISTPGAYVYALKAQTGEFVWEIKESSGLSTPTLFNDALLYGTLSGLVYALDPETGERVWQVESGLASYSPSPVAQVGDVILPGIIGKVSALNTGNASQSWSIKLGEAYLFSNGAVKDNLLFIGSLEGKLYCLSTQPSAKAKPFPLLTAFSDTGSHWARRDLNKLYKLALIRGYEDGSFRPDEQVSRAQMASILSRYLQYEQPSPGYKTTFSDISKHWAAGSIAAMQEKGIAGGYKDARGNMLFKPDHKIKRGEAMVMLARALNLTKPSAGFVSKFNDISSYWAKDAVMALEEKGLIGGYTENGKVLFKPEKDISRAEIGVLFVRIVESNIKQ